MNTTATAPATTSVSSSSTRISVPKWGIPISRKAYIRFVERIRSVYADDPAKASNVERSLELYLCRDTDYTLFLADPADRRGFEFLRQEVDKAIECSRNARMRARMRREAKEASANIPAQVPTHKQQPHPEPGKNPTEPTENVPETSTPAEPRENTVPESTAEPDSSPRVKDTARQRNDNKNRPQGNPHGRRSDRRARNGRKVSVKSFRSRQNASTRVQP